MSTTRDRAGNNRGVTQGNPRRVFVSYAHTTDDHVELVRRLWMLLRENGVDAKLDLPASQQRQDWPLWMLEQFRQADFVLVVASDAYRRRADGEAAPDEGRGVQFEGAILRELCYQDRATWSKRVLPVILPGAGKDGIPLFLGPATCTSYRLGDFGAAAMEPLLRVITDQPAHVEPPLGRVPDLPVRPLLTASPIAELTALTGALGKLPELSGQAGRNQALRLLPPEIRNTIDEAPSAHLHLLAVVQGCARFHERGRTALLEILSAVLPAGDPAVREAIGLIRTARIFD